MLIQKCFPIPTCKKTPSGGNMIAAMMRRISKTFLQN